MNNRDQLKKSLAVRLVTNPDVYGDLTALVEMEIEDHLKYALEPEITNNSREYIKALNKFIRVTHKLATGVELGAPKYGYKFGKVANEPDQGNP